MNARFRVAGQIGNRGALLFRSRATNRWRSLLSRPGQAQQASRARVAGMGCRHAHLAQARNPADWNSFHSLLEADVPLRRTATAKTSISQPRRCRCRCSASWAKGLAAPLQSGSPRFLLVFLRGACDSNSLLVVPTHSDFYQARPNIAIAVRDRPTGLWPEYQWGLHPALQKQSAATVPNRAGACFVPFAGSNDLSRNHFETRTRSSWASPRKAGKILSKAAF